MALPKLDVPRYPVTIPSTGEEYIMRPYLVKEEKILLLAMESQDPKQIALAIRNLINNCIEGEINIDSLAGFDIEKLFLELRGISVGEKIQLQTKCQAEGCEHPNAVEIDIKDIQLKDYNPDDSIIKLSDDVGVTMRYPTIDLLNDMEGDLDSLDTLMNVVTSCINTISPVLHKRTSISIISKLYFIALQIDSIELSLCFPLRKQSTLTQ